MPYDQGLGLRYSNLYVRYINSFSITMSSFYTYALYAKVAVSQMPFGVMAGFNFRDTSHPTLTSITSVTASRDAPRDETNHRYFEFKRL
jgi:hypothetical protein